MVKNPPANARDAGDLDPWVRTSPLFLPGESHGQKSLVGYSTWGCKESDMIA